MARRVGHAWNGDHTLPPREEGGKGFLALLEPDADRPRGSWALMNLLTTTDPPRTSDEVHARVMGGTSQFHGWARPRVRPRPSSRTDLRTPTASYHGPGGLRDDSGGGVRGICLPRRVSAPRQGPRTQSAEGIDALHKRSVSTPSSGSSTSGPRRDALPPSSPALSVAGASMLARAKSFPTAELLEATTPSRTSSSTSTCRALHPRPSARTGTSRRQGGRVERVRDDEATRRHRRAQCLAGLADGELRPLVQAPVRARPPRQWLRFWPRPTVSATCSARGLPQLVRRPWIDQATARCAEHPSTRPSTWRGATDYLRSSARRGA